MGHAVSESRKRLDQLEQHLREENPILLEAVQRFRVLDRIVHGMRLLPTEESFATKVPWWPVVSILGTFSAGKSSFVNSYLEYPLQRTGNQAVDDKFTVVCHAADQEPRVLPGTALDADPRFPFFRASVEIDRVAPGEGKRIDAYLQLKTCPSEVLRGKILIDSPGFDADAQRTSILRLTDHIIDLSDLVLVFFDARHPEPGAMRDTLNHLVAALHGRADPNKFLFILNQIDTTARENNLEEVYASWQRGLATHQLTAGRFYCIYNPEAAVPIEDSQQQTRVRERREADYAEVADRIHRVEVSRAYRIVDALENTCLLIRDQLVPKLAEALGRWRRLVWAFDAIVFGSLAVVALVLILRDGWQHWVDWYVALPGTDLGLGPIGIEVLKAAVVVAVAWFLHTRLRLLATGLVRGRLEAQPIDRSLPLQLGRAFLHSTRQSRPTWCKRPAGWSRRAERALKRVLEGTSSLVQKLNDRFARPAGAEPAAARTEVKESSAQ